EAPSWGPFQINSAIERRHHPGKVTGVTRSPRKCPATLLLRLHPVLDYSTEKRQHPQHSMSSSSFIFLGLRCIVQSLNLSISSGLRPGIRPAIRSHLQKAPHQVKSSRPWQCSRYITSNCSSPCDSRLLDALRCFLRRLSMAPRPSACVRWQKMEQLRPTKV
ncbi:hypothetical protein BHM03_00031765, partial [Ensete ventricosum]